MYDRGISWLGEETSFHAHFVSAMVSGCDVDAEVPDLPCFDLRLNFRPILVTKLGFRSAGVGEAAISDVTSEPRIPCSEKRDAFAGGEVGEAKLPLSVPGTRPEVGGFDASVLSFGSAAGVDVVDVGAAVGLEERTAGVDGATGATRVCSASSATFCKDCRPA